MKYLLVNKRVLRETATEREGVDAHTCESLRQGPPTERRTTFHCALKARKDKC